MTTPSPGSSGTNVMQNQLTMTQAAVQAFEEAVNDLQAIYNAVTDANMTLNGTMISPSSSVWQNATGQWTEDFNKLTVNLQSISTQLSQQVNQMQQNEQNNVSLAQGVTSLSAGYALS
jgi:uncharacterized protein YukE